MKLTNEERATLEEFCVIADSLADDAAGLANHVDRLRELAAPLNSMSPITPIKDSAELIARAPGNSHESRVRALAIGMKKEARGLLDSV